MRNSAWRRAGRDHSPYRAVRRQPHVINPGITLVAARRLQAQPDPANHVAVGGLSSVEEHVLGRESRWQQLCGVCRRSFQSLLFRPTTSGNVGIGVAAHRTAEVFLELRLGHRTQLKLGHLSTITDRLRWNKRDCIPHEHANMRPTTLAWASVPECHLRQGVITGHDFALQG
jgi:hypothetical protein